MIFLLYYIYYKTIFPYTMSGNKHCKFNVLVYRVLEIINGLRYDDEGEIAKKASTTILTNKIFRRRFHALIWKIAETIGFDICSIYDEGDGNYVIYQILNWEENDLEFVKIRFEEDKKKATITFFSSIDEMN